MSLGTTSCFSAPFSQGLVRNIEPVKGKQTHEKFILSSVSQLKNTAAAANPDISTQKSELTTHTQPHNIFRYSLSYYIAEGDSYYCSRLTSPENV
jgi:hypothetical protein